MRFGPYPGRVVSVHDGDTIRVEVDLGFGVWQRGLSARLYGINAPELSTPAGKLAREYLKTLVAPGDPVTVWSFGWDKYGGRFDAEIARENGDVVNHLMIEAGHAKVMTYKAEDPAGSA